MTKKVKRVLFAEIYQFFSGDWKYDQQTFQAFVRLIYSHTKRGYLKIMRDEKEFLPLLDDFITKTKFLDGIFDIEDSSRLFFYFNGWTTPAYCALCGKVLTAYIHPLDTPENILSRHCSHVCMTNDPKIKAKQKAAKIKNHTTTKDQLDRQKAENRAKYGCDYYIQSEDFKQKALATMLSHGYDHPMHSDEIKGKVSDTYFAKTGYRSTFENPEVQRNIKQKWFYDGKYFDSSFEIAYYIWLTDHQIEFTYQPDVTFEYEHDGVKHFYCPDFIVEGKLVELKGAHFFTADGKMHDPYDHSLDNKYEAKHQCMLRNGVEIVRSDSEFAIQVTRFITQKYGKNYLKQFKAQKSE